MAVARARFPTQRNGDHAVVISTASEELQASCILSVAENCAGETLLVARAADKGKHRVRKMTMQQLHDASHLGSTILSQTVDHMDYI